MCESAELTDKIEPLVNSYIGMARSIARKSCRNIDDLDDLESEAMLALLEAARNFREIPGDPENKTFRSWATLYIRRAIRKRVSDASFGGIAVPEWLKREAERCRAATEKLKARGILRPSLHQIAGESRVDLGTVELVHEIPGVIVRQSLVDWAEDRESSRLEGEPELVPLFPIAYFTPWSACPHNRPIADGSHFCCMVCHQSGMDEHPAVKAKNKPGPKRSTGSPKLDASLDRPLANHRKRRSKNPADTGQH